MATHTLTDRKYSSLIENNKTSAENNHPGSVPYGQISAGLYTTAAPTLANNDFGFMRLDDEGYLLCTLKSAIEVGGDLAVDVWSYQLVDGTDANAWVFTHDADLSAVSEVWQGFGGYDETADRFRAFPIGTDNAAAPTDAQGVPVMGEYNATPVVYGDGDFTILQTTSAGALWIVGGIIDESAMPATPEFVATGGEYRASETTYTDGDATVLQSDVNGYLKTRPKGYDVGTDSQKVFEVSPVNQQFVSESLADVDAAYADNTTTRYPSNTGATMDGYADFSLTGKLICSGGTVTLTIEATNDEDTTNADWIDVTKAFYDAENNTTGNANYQAAGATLTYAIDADNFNYRYYRVVVISAGVGDAASTVIVKARRKAI